MVYTSGSLPCPIIYALARNFLPVLLLTLRCYLGNVLLRCVFGRGPLKCMLLRMSIVEHMVD